MAAPAEDTQQILEAAFDQAFSPPPSRRQSVVPTAKVPNAEEIKPVATEESSSAVVSESTSPPAEEETWKQEYDEQVKAWRAQSAEAREKAERVREQWEAKRAAEREEAAKRKAAGITEPELETIPGPQTGITSVASSTVLVSSQEEDKAHVREAETKTEESTLASPTPANVRDEPQGHIAASTISHPDTIDGSQKWEEINSTSTSSYPSISFPEQSTPPLEHQHPRHKHHSHQEPVPAPSTATLSVFDSSLSTHTRLKALASSLAINFLLPFVNGVMLGFGEIFAKNFVLGWLGGGSTATTVGLQRSRSGSRR